MEKMESKAPVRHVSGKEYTRPAEAKYSAKQDSALMEAWRETRETSLKPHDEKLMFRIIVVGSSGMKLSPPSYEFEGKEEKTIIILFEFTNVLMKRKNVLHCNAYFDSIQSQSHSHSQNNC